MDNRSNTRLAGPAAGLLMVVLAFVAHATSLGAGFVWLDDGTAPLPLHLGNVLLHGLTAAMAGAVLQVLRVRGAWLAAALFAVHPVQVGSVAWIAQRGHILSALLCLTAAWMFLGGGDRPRTPGIRREVATVALFACALLADPVSAPFPVVLALCAWWRAGRLSRAHARVLVPLALLGAAAWSLDAWTSAAGAGVRLVPAGSWDATPLERLLAAGRGLWFCLGKVVWPEQLAFVYEPWRRGAAWLYPLGVLLVLAVLGWRVRVWGRGPLVGGLSFIVLLLPSLARLDADPYRDHVVADPFLYLAALAPLAMGGALLQRLPRGVRRNVGVGVLLGVMATLSNLQALDYRNLETLWVHTIERSPRAWAPYERLGHLLRERGDEETEERLFLRAIEAMPGRVEAYASLARLYERQGRYEEAEEVLLRAPDSR